MSENIKATLKTLGWKEIEKKFIDEILLNTRSIRTNGRRYEDIAVDTIAKKDAAKIVKKVLLEIKRLGSVEVMTKQSYK